MSESESRNEVDRLHAARPRSVSVTVDEVAAAAAAAAVARRQLGAIIAATELVERLLRDHGKQLEVVRAEIERICAEPPSRFTENRR